MFRMLFPGLAIVLPAVALGQGFDPNIFVPSSSVPVHRLVHGWPWAHTNHLIYLGPPMAPDFGIGPEPPRFGPSVSLFAPGGYSPTQIRAAYQMPSSGGSGMAIAIVDAYHYGTSLNDFNVFASQFGLAQEPSSTATSNSNQVFQVVYQGSNPPAADASWAQEEALDIEWAHALAPNAKIYLVEANSASLSDLLTSVTKAASLPNVKAVSMSWGVDEFSGQASNDGHFQHSGVAYFSSSGDSGGVTSWPATSMYVIGVGGTRLTLAGTAFVAETAWTSGGGGQSAFNFRPAYEHRIYTIAGGRRGGPDIASDADPATGCAVYDSTPFQNMSGWMIFGGTSLSTPSIAGMYVTSGAHGLNSYNELVRIYGALGSAGFRDITTGTAGSYSAAPGWDFLTGVGTPQGTTGF